MSAAQTLMPTATLRHTHANRLFSFTLRAPLYETNTNSRILETGWRRGSEILRTLIALAENLDLVPSTYTSSSRYSDASCNLYGHWVCDVLHLHTHKTLKYMNSPTVKNKSEHRAIPRLFTFPTDSTTGILFLSPVIICFILFLATKPMSFSGLDI